MNKLKLSAASINKISLTDGTEHDLSNLKFELKQFHIPKAFLILDKEVQTKAEKVKNGLGELVETGKFTTVFKGYDRALVELAIANNLNEFGSPITVWVKGQDSLPILDMFDKDEFIPIQFENLSILPKKVQKKSYYNGNMIDVWQFAEIEVNASGYKIQND